MKIIKDIIHTARKEHKCDLCNCAILPKTKYVYQYVNNGEVYELHEHVDCNFLLNELWYFMSDFEGVNSEQYKDGLEVFSELFVCPRCEEFSEYEDPRCAYDFKYCHKSIVNLLKQYEPVKIGSTGHRFMLARRLNPINQYRGVTLNG